MCIFKPDLSAAAALKSGLKMHIFFPSKIRSGERVKGLEMAGPRSSNMAWKGGLTKGDTSLYYVSAPPPPFLSMSMKSNFILSHSPGSRTGYDINMTLIYNTCQ